MSPGKLAVVLDPQTEGGFVVTCPGLPELVAEGETVEDALRNATDALAALIEAFHDLGRPLPTVLKSVREGTPLSLEAALPTGYASEQIHRGLFPTPPEPRTLAELKEGTRRYIRDRRAND